MTEIVKKNAPLILSEIKKAKHILLHCHPSPDPDSIGSVLAMKLALKQMGKKVTAIRGDSEIPKAFAFPGVETIEQKSYGEIDAGEYDLFIILDSGSIDMISMDGVVFPDSMMTVVIDHHASNKGYGKINFVDPKYSATSEILFDLFNEIGIKIDKNIATNLFMGIYADTGGFRHGQSVVHSLEVASKLALIASDFTKTIFIMENSNSKESLIFEGMLLSSVKDFWSGKLAIASINYDEIKKNNFKGEDIYSGHISNKLKSVVGTCISATLIEIEPMFIKASFRCQDSQKYDVSKLAIALGGGGHVSASGARIYMNIPDAIEKVVKKAKEIYNL